MIALSVVGRSFSETDEPANRAGIVVDYGREFAIRQWPNSKALSRRKTKMTA
jgi:hypothetical protein